MDIVEEIFAVIIDLFIGGGIINYNRGDAWNVSSTLMGGIQRAVWWMTKKVVNRGIFCTLQSDYLKPFKLPKFI